VHAQDVGDAALAFLEKNGRREIASCGRPGDAFIFFYSPNYTFDILHKLQAMLLRESMGVSADATAKAFPSADVASFFNRIYGNVEQDIFCHIGEKNTNHIIIAVDPSGGGSSQFAVFSLVQLPNGSIMVSRL
jgi:hypothetical protein